MGFTIDGAGYAEYLRRAAKKIAASSEYVSALDAATGDGDHWANINLGFENIVAVCGEFDSLSMDGVFKKVGMLMMSKIGGSSGVLYGGAYIAAAKVVAGKKSIDSIELCAALEAMVVDMMERGKAKPGDKTMIDALYPAVEAFKMALVNNVGDAELLSVVKQAALDGAAATADMRAARGRASYRTDKGVGHLDAGAVTMAYQIECLCDYIAESLHAVADNTEKR